jgi:hypothetical protein
MGFLLGVAAYPLARRGFKPVFPSRRTLALAALPAAADFALSRLGIYETPHLVRAATGLLLGAGAAAAVLPGLLDLVSRSSDTRGEKCRTNPAD